MNTQVLVAGAKRLAGALFAAAILTVLPWSSCSLSQFLIYFTQMSFVICFLEAGIVGLRKVWILATRHGRESTHSDIELSIDVALSFVALIILVLLQPQRFYFFFGV